MLKRDLIPLGAFLLGFSLIAGAYFGILTWAQGRDYAAGQFLLNRWYVLPIWIGFGIQAALYSILRFRLFVPVASPGHPGAILGANGATSTAAMVACCLHHAADLLPVLGLSAAAAFLARYQRPFMLAGLGMNVAGILVMLAVLYRERQKLRTPPKLQPVLETK